jgi:hypothetical protein
MLKQQQQQHVRSSRRGVRYSNTSNSDGTSGSVAEITHEVSRKQGQLNSHSDNIALMKRETNPLLEILPPVPQMRGFQGQKDFALEGVRYKNMNTKGGREGSSTAASSSTLTRLNPMGNILPPRGVISLKAKLNTLEKEKDAKRNNADLGSAMKTLILAQGVNATKKKEKEKKMEKAKISEIEKERTLVSPCVNPLDGQPFSTPSRALSKALFTAGSSLMVGAVKTDVIPLTSELA